MSHCSSAPKGLSRPFRLSRRFPPQHRQRLSPRARRLPYGVGAQVGASQPPCPRTELPQAKWQEATTRGHETLPQTPPRYLAWGPVPPKRKDTGWQIVPLQPGDPRSGCIVFPWVYWKHPQAIGKRLAGRLRHNHVYLTRSGRLSWKDDAIGGL